MLSIEGLTKNFGGLAAVSGLDMSVKSGYITGLIGPNGAGKTTVFNLITGFIRPTRGKVIFDGRDITARKPHFIAERGIVRTFQATSLFPGLTVLENIVLACHLKSKVRFWEAVFHTPGSRRKEAAALSRARKILAMVGMEAKANEPTGTLAHGHQRMLGIAIALAAEPRLLLLDEPLSGMNAEEVSTAMELIRGLWQKGMTILLIEHNMRAAMSLCQEIIVLNFGKKIIEGPPEKVRQNEDVIRAYLGTSGYAT